MIDLFSEVKTCDHCGLPPKSKTPVLFGGFRDGDTGELVCYDCKSIHYQKKAKKLKLTKGMLYSEFPERI